MSDPVEKNLKHRGQPLYIDAMGRRGEGIARGEEGRVFVPFTLPGETVLIEREGDRGFLAALVEQSADRVDPFCRHFGRCGGCALQHWRYEAYAAWKCALVTTALRHQGIAAEVGPLIDAGGEGRRRIALHVRYHKGQAQAGFMEPRSHRLLDLDACPIVVPALAGAAELARAIGQVFQGATRSLDVQITATDGGLDCHVKGLRGLSLDQRMDVARIAEAFDLARLTFGRELIAERRPPLVSMGAAQVKLPPGGFLQATAAGEAALSALVEELTAGMRRVADLFCGVGPFALRLAARARIHAVDADAAAVAALTAAARATSGLKPISAEMRDLFKRPLLADELAHFDAVVFDPPRAGAEAQARALATSSVPRVIAVSCDPATFARDAAVLAGGGYRVSRVVPVDQFKWSAHVETVACFDRER
ncbi:class I SAM-dependent RNA methyltransferase [Rhodoligotrophos defluvii]|uniref:class I SAM-dependent RNA methyltransferase n=1 Tax=Rhodoligotrophos defluvii TaxID=2561934 RepID=UPI0010CA182E|nr:methyltransferase [Rhodoligotrophos defluvii]